MRTLVHLLILFFFTSCASVPSGHYIVLKKGENAKTLAKKYKLSPFHIKNQNPGKRFNVGDWIFLPTGRGVLPGIAKRSPAFYSNSRFSWPVPDVRRISSRFGRRWGRKHEGMDIPAPIGTRIIASDSGVVVYSGNEIGGYGNITVISHTNGYFTVYAHADQNFTYTGQRVQKGDVIATVGNTGRSTGPHLHFEIRHESKALNPSEFVSTK